MRSPPQQRALDRWEAWRARYADKLASYGNDVGAEIASTVRERFLAGNFDPLNDEAIRHATMRVAARARIAHGPAGADDSGEQLREAMAKVTT